MLRIGTAGWTLPRAWQGAFAPEGSHLERYAGVFSATEINSSFYRQHRYSTYVRWAATVPAGFQFAVKVPRAITHDQALVAADVLLEVFLEEVSGLGSALGPLLVQLPPSHVFDRARTDDFLGCVRSKHAGPVALEPRHPSWFVAEAGALLEQYKVARVAADPSCVPEASQPGGWPGLVYYRLHGSPRMYYSSYPRDYLAMMHAALDERASSDVEQWCMFDNTTLGAATGNALELERWSLPVAQLE
ncbi:MAG: DUF72 domain-containing protein [Gemmatimonadota bacterium]|nr:DUF72 domain-containing protein [Gemmatimonadota bacterium]